MTVEILFTDSSAPKRFKHVRDIYTKGGFVCVRIKDLILRWPEGQIFQVASKHGAHWGSRAHLKSMSKKRRKK